jgi:hypothetical protein
MNKIDYAKAVDGIALILNAWGSWERANASLVQYQTILIAEQRNPSDEEWNALINSIEANQARINELAAQ